MIEISEPFQIDFLQDGLYSYCEINNVRTITPHYNRYTLICDTTNCIHPSEQEHHYLNIDTLYHDAFSHWVFESAIYLHLFVNLKRNYPKLKLYSRGYKMYKKIFYDYFDICETDIVYHIEPSNLCIFPKPISSLNVNAMDETWKLQVDYFFNELNVSTVSKDIFLLLMPRQRKENYLNNDRVYHTNDIENHLQKEGPLKGRVLHTDEINELKDQIAFLHRSRNVVLTGGSPYFVNGLFCQDTTIVVLDDFVISQINLYVKLKYIHDKICEKNKVHMIKNNNNNTFDYNDIKAYLLYSTAEEEYWKCKIQDVK